MAAYKVEICGVNTSKLPVLKDEEKDGLFSRIKAGDMEARETSSNVLPAAMKMWTTCSKSAASA